MPNPRRQHVGKSRSEKQFYLSNLNQPRSIDPTYQAKSDLLTDSVVINDKEKSGITEPELKHYVKESKIPYKEIIIGIVCAVIAGIILWIVFHLSREVGVIDERTQNLKGEVKIVGENINRINNDINNIKVDVEVIKRKGK